MTRLKDVEGPQRVDERVDLVEDPGRLHRQVLQSSTESQRSRQRRLPTGEDATWCTVARRHLGTPGMIATCTSRWQLPRRERSP